MMTDKERIEVANRLRKAIGLTEFAEVLGFNWTDDRDWVWNDVSNFVADLIEPTMPSDPGEAGLTLVEGFIGEMRHSTKEEQDEYNAMLGKMSVELHPVDRDALLRIAEDLDYEGMGGWADTVNVGSYARRIREALGVTDD